ncbi:MAG TPA: hypothetical protein VG675_22910 [Bryobacteraceae bacterium]|nr:hypothetical protein [Bryobacteraceae bacterium]
MRHKYTCILSSLILFGAAAGYSQVTLNPNATRAVGQPQLTVSSSNPNLVEGRELFNPQGIALDTSASPPILYVADTGNNRILVWKNASQFANGAPADLVIGQPDKFTTFPGGPGTAFSIGLNSPTGLAVQNGNLYVADSGNNRILRFPTPMTQANEFPDLVLGQPNFTTRTANYTGAVSEKGISLSGYQANMAFDASGNLYLTDPGNRRVLRFKASDLAKTGGGFSADLEFGQLDFTSLLPALNPGTSGSNMVANQFAIPSSVAVDGNGRVFVSDSDANRPDEFSRVLVFNPPFSSGQSAARIMGVIPPQTPNVTQTMVDHTLMLDPEGIFILPGNKVGVLDAGSSRILLFDSFDQWPGTGTQFSPSATAVVGQNLDFHNRAANNGQAAASASTYSLPVAAAFSGTELFVADTLNNRVLVSPMQGGTFLAATRVLGQDRFDTSSINLIEGREFQFIFPTTSGLVADAGIAIDSSGDTPHLYVADPYNNRVLGFRDLRSIAPGSRADIVIGQPDMQTAECNYPTNDANQPSQQSLCRPIGLAVDAQGNLYVADSGNGRVLRFPAPFTHQGVLEQADLVLGQTSFNTKITDPTAVTMSRPYGLSLVGTNGLLVSDVAHNRVLFFPMTNGSFTSGEAATKVFGQPNFNTSGTGSSDNAMNAPHHISSDTDGRPYVADTGNSRILIFDQIESNPTGGAHAAQIITGLNHPEGLFVSASTGEIWVADSGSSRSLRFPRFDQLVVSNSATANIPAVTSTLALAQDQFGDLFVADAANRIAIYFPGLSAINGANFLTTTLAPGMVASVFPLGGTFGSDMQAFTDLPSPLPLPTKLADVQVLFNGQPAPLYYVSPNQINFFVPMGAPTGGNADLQIVHQSNGQVLASGQVAMNAASPGIFLLGTSGNLRQAAVLNQDNSVNSPTNPAARGSTIQIFATGQGFVPGAPPDGAAPSGQITTPTTPRVLINTCFVDDCGEPGAPGVTYSGLAPGLVGVWQINVRIPMAVPPAPQIKVVVTLNSQSSTNASSPYATVIAVN